MALKLTVESYLQVVRQSGLIDKDQLQKLLQKFEGQGIDVKKSQAISDALVAADVITNWQAEKLMSGKHKGFFLGKYKLLDLLGKGGMSSVYLAEHVLMRRRCAIKVLPSKRVHDSSYLARFHREAQAVASVDHPNIVRAYDVDCAQDRDSEIHFLVMEHVTGRSLQEIIMQDGPMEFTDAVENTRQAADGLDHAHRAGLVHRDIKPGNILVDATGVVKILDMGLARFFEDRDENPLTVAHDEKVLGTADYLAPEQALDSHTVDQRADIYSLGCTLYFLLTGHPPFTEGTLAQRLMWHQVKAFPPLKDARLDCPQSLSDLLNKMVEKKPEDRFQTAHDISEAFHKWLQDNASPEWHRRHATPARNTGSSARISAPMRDLHSDSSSISRTAANASAQDATTPADHRAEQASELPATKISKPGDTSAKTKLSEPTQPSVPPPALPVVTPVAVAAPVVAAPVVAAPIAMPVAHPVTPPVAPPIARPVAPIAAPVVPIAAPVAQPIAQPVAQPVAPAAIPVPVVAATAAPISAAPRSTAALPSAAPLADPEAPTQFFDPNSQELFFGNDTAGSHQTDANESAETPTVPETEEDLFSLFGGESDAADEEQPTKVPLAVSAKTPPTVFSAVEPVEITETELPAPDVSAFENDFQASTPASSKVVSTKPRGKSKGLLLVTGVVVLAVAAGGFGAFQHFGGKGNSTSSTTKKKLKTGSKQVTSETPTPSKHETHDIAIKVGHGGEFDSIGRALYSIAENRADHEKEASGKPLRFVVTVSGTQPFEESLVLDESFPGELHLKSDGARKVKLTPPGTDPAITIKGLSNVTIENFAIDLPPFSPKDFGIRMTGSTSGCRIKNCLISGAGKAGIELLDAKGADDAITIEGVTFQNASPEAVGILLAKGDGKASCEHVVIQRCRFLSSSAAVFVDCPVKSLTIRNCGSSRQTNGVRFAGATTLKKLTIEKCSFFETANAAILFDDMLAADSAELKWHGCLFAAVKKSELQIAKNYDAKMFDGFMSSESAITNNWSDRAASKFENGERDVIAKDEQRSSRIEFASTDPKSDLFLVAKPTTPYKSAGISSK